MAKQDIVYAINEELDIRFSNGSNDEVIDFMTTALGNFFSTDQLVEFYEFLKEE